MNIKQRFSTIFSLILFFLFLYTFKINLDPTKQFNIANFGIIVIVFILWLFAGYLFLVKDIIKSSQTEYNGLVLVFILLGIIFFYYNPLPNPSNYYLDLPRIFYFALTIIIFSVLIITFRKERTLTFILALALPISAQSFLVNVLNNTTYTKYTIHLVIVFITLSYLFNHSVRKSKKS